MEENRINDIIATSLEKIKELSETGTVVGDQIKTDNGTVIIPVSKVSLGFVSGGLDFDNKKNKKDSEEKSNASFGGGGGTGLSITPIGFLVIKPNGDVNMLNCDAPAVVANNSTFAAVSSLIEKSPKIIRELKETFKKDEVPTEKAFTEEE